MVKRFRQAVHSRLRRMEAPSSAIRVSTTRESGLWQKGQCTPQRYVARVRRATLVHICGAGRSKFLLHGQQDSLANIEGAINIIETLNISDNLF